MSSVHQRPNGRIDWDAGYRDGRPPWDTGRPSAELVRLVEAGTLPRGATLELGCGTGANAIFLARRRFDVTAVDASPMALERARVRAEQEDALLRLVLADVFDFGRNAGAFDLVVDVGFYHFIRQTDLDRFLDLLWRVTKPGSWYFALAGSNADKSEGGPPRVSKREIHRELGRLFEPVDVHGCRLESLDREDGYPAWSCLMRRPMVPAG